MSKIRSIVFVFAFVWFLSSLFLFVKQSNQVDWREGKQFRVSIMHGDGSKEDIITKGRWARDGDLICFELFKRTKDGISRRCFNIESVRFVVSEIDYLEAIEASSGIDVMDWKPEIFRTASRSNDFLGVRWFVGDENVSEHEVVHSLNELYYSLQIADE